MKEERDQFRDWLQESFRDYEVAPEPSVWKRIEQSLFRFRRRRTIVIWSICSSAAALLILLAIYTGGIFNSAERVPASRSYSSHQSVHPDQRADHNTAQPNQEDVKPTPVSKGHSERYAGAPSPTAKMDSKSSALTIQTPAHNPAVQPSLQVLKRPVEVTDRNKTVEKNPAPKNEKQDNHLLATNGFKPSGNEKTTQQKTPSVVSVAALPEKNNESTIIHSISARKSKGVINNKMNLTDAWIGLREANPNLVNEQDRSNRALLSFSGLSLTNSSGLIVETSRSVMKYPDALASQLSTSMINNSIKVFNSSMLSSLDIANLFQNNSRRFQPPVVFGLNLSWQLQDHWSVETGLQYSLLQSNGLASITSSNAVQILTSFDYRVAEQLHYLGIPLIVNYHFTHPGKIAVYLSAGFSLDKGISASYKATPVDRFPGMEPIYSHDPIKGFQSSLSTGMGVSYRFVPHFELFGQPSASYYFPSQGKTTTIYSKHPLIFNLRSGIRYNFR